MSPLLVAAYGFAFIVGANDGAALLGANLTGKAVRPLPGLIVVVVAVVVVPGVVGMAVADTIATGLISFDIPEGPRALLVAILVTIGLVAASSRLGVPTSVTQALAGAMLGAGMAAGSAVDVRGASQVILALALVPLAAGAAALLVTFVIVRLRMWRDLAHHLRQLHAVGYLVGATAYAANDGQKLYAVTAMAVGTSPRFLGADETVCLAALFAAGTAFGLRRMTIRFRRLVPARPLHTVIAGFAAGTAVLGSAAFGAPVSMSHATAASLIGSTGTLQSYRAVRWNEALKIGATWFTTFPASMSIAAIVVLVIP